MCLLRRHCSGIQTKLGRNDCGIQYSSDYSHQFPTRPGKVVVGYKSSKPARIWQSSMTVRFCDLGKHLTVCYHGQVRAVAGGDYADGVFTPPGDDRPTARQVELQIRRNTDFPVR